METQMQFFSVFFPWKLDKSAKYNHTISLFCYNTDFNIFTEEGHFQHNKMMLVAMGYGCHGNGFLDLNLLKCCFNPWNFDGFKHLYRCKHLIIIFMTKFYAFMMKSE